MVKQSGIQFGVSLDQQLDRLIEQGYVSRTPNHPILLPTFFGTTMPSVSQHKGCIIYAPDNGGFKGSDGSNWINLSGGGGGGSGTVTSITAGTGLAGGTITVSGTISLASIADQRLLANTSGASAAPVATAFSAITGVGSALKWTTARTLTLGTDATGFVAFDGSADFTLNLTIAAGAVTYAKMQNVSAASRVLGRGSSGAGAVQEIDLGAGLEMSGTTLRSGASGVAVVDFGSTGASDASVAVADTSVTSNSVILATVLAKASADHTADEHLVEELEVMGGGINAGVGFNIYARTRNVALRGTWNVAYHRMG